MNPFIPEEDKPAFERFLSDHGLESAAVTRPVVQPPPALPVQGKSGGNKKQSSRKGHNQNVTDIDKFIHDIDSQMDGVLEDTTDF